MQNEASSGTNKKTVKSFVREDGRVTIACPYCQKVRNISVFQFSKRKTRVKVQCSCKHTFTVILDYRQTYRKPTSLTGTYYLYTPASGAKLGRIKNISFDGICLETDGFHPVKAGQKGYVDFTLDDKKQTKIKKEFSIQSVSGKQIGCKFKKDQAFEKELGFYLRSGL